MKKGVEIVKEVYFAADKETAKIYNMEYSEQYSFMQIIMDYDKREMRTFLKSTWNSSYDVHQVTKF